MNLKVSDFPTEIQQKNKDLAQTLEKRKKNPNTYLVFNGFFGIVTLEEKRKKRHIKWT